MNCIQISGYVSKAPEFSHEIYGRSFYEFSINSYRLSGISDEIPCIIPEDALGDLQYGSQILVFGEIKTRNVNKKLDIYVFAEHFEETTDMSINKVNLQGFICKEIIFRETPLKRYIADAIIASNRVRSNKSDYIPCLFWGKNAMYASGLGVSTELSITGRLQSREYIKELEDGTTESRTAYELSVSSFNVVEEF